MQDVGDDGGDGEDESQYVEPERGANPAAALRAKTKLQEKSGESDGRHHDQGEWAGEGRAARVDHHQSQGEEQQSGGDDAPALGLGCWGRVGSGVGQGVPSQVIQGGVRVFQIKRNRLSFLQFPLGQTFCPCQCIGGLDLYIRLHSRSFPVGLGDGIDDSHAGNANGEVVINAMRHSPMTVARRGLSHKRGALQHLQVVG